MPPLSGKPEQQRLTLRSGVLTSISSRQRSAISCRPLPERTLDKQVNQISLCYAIFYGCAFVSSH